MEMEQNKTNLGFQWIKNAQQFWIEKNCWRNQDSNSAYAALQDSVLPAKPQRFIV